MRPSKDNMHAIEEFPMPETFMQVRAFCGLAGHYRRFIKGFANIACPLYDVLDKETKRSNIAVSLLAFTEEASLGQKWDSLT